MSNVVVKISKRNANGVEAWEGTVALPGISPAKIVKAKTSDTKFGTRSALTGAAERLAERYNFTVKFEGAGADKPAKKAAKKPARKETAPQPSIEFAN